MLAKGDAVGAKFAALKWISSHPEEPWAHWYLAKAYDRLEEYVKAKRTLTELQQLNPSWRNDIEPWLNSVEEKLRPKSLE